MELATCKKLPTPRRRDPSHPAHQGEKSGVPNSSAAAVGGDCWWPVAFCCLLNGPVFLFVSDVKQLGSHELHEL